jgi:chromosome segregation ATPase
MAKIDTAKIENYAEMSAEEKLKALEEYEFETPAPKENDEVTKLKAALSKANSDAAEWKRQFREKQTEAERAEAERKEHEAAVEDELRTLRRDKTVSGYLAQYLALGYGKELALKAADATADGDAATTIACQQEFLEAKTKEIEAAALNKQPPLTTGAPPTAKGADKEALNKTRSYFGLPPIK